MAHNCIWLQFQKPDNHSKVQCAFHKWVCQFGIKATQEKCKFNIPTRWNFSKVSKQVHIFPWETHDHTMEKRQNRKGGQAMRSNPNSTTTSLRPKIGRLRILNRIVRVSHIYSFPSIYPSLIPNSYSLLPPYLTCHFLLFLLILFRPSSIFSHFHKLNYSLFPIGWLIDLLCSLHMTKPSQTTLPHLFISRGHSYGYGPISKWISWFHILSFLVLPLIHLNILISATLIILMCCFLVTQHLVP